jgi:hypothetical protein
VTALADNTPTRLQASQNRTNPCNATPITTPTTGGTGTSTTTTTVPGPRATVPPSTASATQLLQDAQTEFDAANAALAAGRLGDYQTHIRNAQNDVASAYAKLGAATTTTVPAARSTTVPKATTTTGAP